MFKFLKIIRVVRFILALVLTASESLIEHCERKLAEENEAKGLQTA